MRYKQLIIADLYRILGESGSPLRFIKQLLFNPGFKFLFYFRLISHFGKNSIIGFFAYLFYRRLSVKYGYQIPLTVKVGHGLLLPHFGFVVINGGTIIGHNCNILQGVTLGNTKGGKQEGTPIIGNNVYIGPSAAVVGGVHVGDDVLIAPNAYVNFDVPSHFIVIGNPGKIISKENPTALYLRNVFYTINEKEFL